MNYIVWKSEDILQSGFWDIDQINKVRQKVVEVKVINESQRYFYLQCALYLLACM